MDGVPISLQLAALGVLLLVSGFFSIAETSLMSLNRYRLRHLVKEGHRGAKLASVLLSQTDKLLGVIPVSYTHLDVYKRQVVNVTLDARGAGIFKNVTRDNVGKRMAILLIEKGSTEVITAPTINEEIGGGRVQISGMDNPQEATDISLLLRAGALAAPMEIIEERTVGPSMGQENINRGVHSTLWGFAAIAAMMIVYYMVFGGVSVLALGVNLLLLVAILSMLQATLTLPGLAAIALALGMAIDANVLINERVREELRNGNTPQASIHAGYDRAFDTILDSNVTTLIAGLALFMFGTGPIKGFAVVHVLGILTSMFSAVLVSRAIVNIIYGYRRKLDKISIGQIYKAN